MRQFFLNITNKWNTEGELIREGKRERTRERERERKKQK